MCTVNLFHPGLGLTVDNTNGIRTNVPNPRKLYIHIYAYTYIKLQRTIMTRCPPASGNFWGYKRKKIQYQVEHKNKEQNCACLLENKNSLCIAQKLLLYHLNPNRTIAVFKDSLNHWELSVSQFLNH